MIKNRNFLLSIGVSILIAGLCHNLAGGAEEKTDDVKKGKELFAKQGCLNCHYVKGDGGLIGPPLDGIGKYRTEDEIVDTLTQRRRLPEDYPAGILDPREFMRHIRISQFGARKIAKFLISLPALDDLAIKGHGNKEEDALPAGFKFEPQKPSASSRKGMAVFKDVGCAACHSVGGVGGKIAPALDGVGARRSKAYIDHRISEGAIVSCGEHQYMPTMYSMPPSELSEVEIKQVTDFLMTLPVR